MQQLVDRDYYTDLEILRDPYAYFDALREKGPVCLDTRRGIAFVTGFDELIEVARNSADFSAANTVLAGAVRLPFEPQGDDIGETIEANRAKFIEGESLVALDGLQHSLRRALVTPLFTPSRLRQIEGFVRETTEALVAEAVAKGGCDIIADIATPIATLVIAELLGVPADAREVFLETIKAAPPPGSINGETTFEPVEVMKRYFTRYITERREKPRDDTMSVLANAVLADGTQPSIEEIAGLCTFLFGAGQDTSVKLTGNAMRYVVEEQGLQDRLRAEPSQIAAMLEEVLRLAGSAKCNARLARRDTRIGSTPIPAGTQVVLAFAAANRDPRRWDDPNAFRMGRAKIAEHLAFGRGAHTCAGAPLARMEVRTTFETLFEQTSHITIDEDRHGPRSARSLEYEPSFILRGFSELHLKLS